jgi:hypothetical protein
MIFEKIPMIIAERGWDFFKLHMIIADVFFKVDNFTRCLWR